MAGFLGMDVSLQALKMALNGLSLRQQTIGRNLANVDTPGYHAQSVKFEDAIRTAVNNSEQRGEAFQPVRTNPAHLDAAGAASGFTRVEARPGGSERADGNNVDIDVELTDMSETGIRYQTLTQAASKKLQLLKTIAEAR